MKTTLLALTLNEINGMKAIMPKINKERCDQTIIVDGGSTASCSFGVSAGRPLVIAAPLSRIPSA